MRVQEKFNGKFSVKNQLEATIGYLSKITDVNVGEVLEYQLMSNTNEPKAPTTAHIKHSYKTIKLIKHAKGLGFNVKEIRKLLVFWNK